MNDTQARLLAFKAQELEMQAHDVGNEAAKCEASARGCRAQQERLLAEAAELRAALDPEPPDQAAS